LLLVVDNYFWCSSLGDALAFAHFGSSSHGIVFLAILGTLYHLSLGCGQIHCLSACLLLSVYNFFFFFDAMLLFRHNLHYNCGLYVIDMFNLFEHCISLEIPVFDSCVGLERLHLFD
jgi:hypothetical protein